MTAKAYIPLVMKMEIFVRSSLWGLGSTLIEAIPGRSKNTVRISHMIDLEN